MIPYSKHTISYRDIFEVALQIKKGSLTQGPRINQFEKSVADYVGSRFAVAVSSATAGLHLSLLSLGIKPGSEVITSPLSFLSSANCVLYSNLKPVFVDIDPISKNLDLNKVEEELKKNPNIKAIIPVHYGGLPTDITRLESLKVKFRIHIIEDAAHSLGARYESGERVGKCTASDATVFSFHPVKSVTTGEGGVITTNSKELYSKLINLRSHGIEQNFETFENSLLGSTDGYRNPWYREMVTLGYHYRLTEIQAALGISQMKKLDRFIVNRRRLALNYDELIYEEDIFQPAQKIKRHLSSHHLYPIEIDFTKTHISKMKLMKELKSRGIGSQVHYMPIALNPYFQMLGYSVENIPYAMNYYEKCLSIPLFPKLKFSQQKQIINEIREILK